MGKGKFYELLKKFGFTDKRNNSERGVVVPEYVEEMEGLCEIVAA